MHDMNAKVHPLVVVLVIFLTFTAIGVWVWGSGEAKKIGGPAELKKNPDGYLYIQIQNQILEHDAEGIFRERHDLAELGVEQLLGSIAFFSNGDILLRRGPDSRTMSQNIRAYQRKTNIQSLLPQSPGTGLYRCNLDTTECRIFGPAGIDFKAAYSASIDWRTDEVYIADTSRHVLHKYSADGEALAGPVGGFRFPNQLSLHEDQLYVLNTNQHEVRKLDPRTESFGRTLGAFDLDPPVAIEARQIWPSHIARVGDEWWINNMRNTMSEGGIYIFNNDWSYSRRVLLPPGADPISVLPFQDEVLISDWNNDRIYRVATDGELLENFSSSGLEKILAESRAKRLQFRIYSYSGIALFILVLAGLFVRVLAADKADRPGVKGAARVPEARSLNEPIMLEPNPETAKKNKFALRIVFLLVTIMSAVLALIIILSGQFTAGLQLFLPVTGLLAICLLIVWISRVNSGTSISVSGTTVTLRDHTGRESSCLTRNVFYDHTAIATPDMAVFFGQPQMPVYDAQVLKDQLFPRLADAQRVSIWKMQAVLFRVRHPQGLTAALALFGVVAGAFWIVLQSLTS